MGPKPDGPTGLNSQSIPDNSNKVYSMDAPGITAKGLQSPVLEGASEIIQTGVFTETFSITDPKTGDIVSEGSARWETKVVISEGDDGYHINKSKSYIRQIEE